MGTKRRIVDEIKVDCGLVPTSLASTNATGKYFHVGEWRKFLAHLQIGAMVVAGSTKVEILQAKTILGGSAALITGAEATLVGTAALQKARVALITLATFVATNTVIVTVTKDGVSTAYTFTAHATVTTPANREFSISGTDTADATELLVCINHATYGVPGIVGTQAAGAVTLTATDDRTVISISNGTDDATCVKAVTEANATVEVDRGMIDVAGGFKFVGIKVTTASATVVAAASLLRFGRFNPSQQVGASASVGA